MVASSSKNIAPTTALPGERRYLIGAQATAVTQFVARAAPVARWPVGAHVPYQNGSRLFQVEHVLAGGMGVVYVVTDVQSGEPFVVKAIKEPLSHHSLLRARFQREAEAWISLQKHPNIVQALGFEYLEDQPHIVLEYVSGGSLRSLLHNTELPIPKILRLAVEICRGMRHASLMGITAHRDLKPDNILLTANATAKVTDFGLVKMWDERTAQELYQDIGLPGLSPNNSTLTRPDAPGFGTKEYMPPEQWLSANQVDIRSDIYAFGVMLYEMLTGIRPFYGKNHDELRDRHFNYEPVAPSALRPDIPASVDSIIGRCLKKNQADRYSDFGPLEKDLTRILQHEFRQVVSLLSKEQMSLEELNERGAALFNLGKYHQALNTFHEVIRVDSRHAVAWANRGVILAELQHYDQALISFDEALRVNPENAVVLTNKGMTLAELGRYEDALACLNQATNLDHFLQPAWRYRAETLNHLEEFEQAYYSAIKARQLDDSDSAAYYQEAVALMHLGRLQQALEAVANFEAQMGGQMPRSLLLRAHIAYRQGHREETTRLCATISHDAAEYSAALLLGMQCALELGYLDEVEILLEDVQSPAQSKAVLDLMKRTETQQSTSTRFLAMACETAIQAGDFCAARTYLDNWQAQAHASGQSPEELRQPRLRVHEIAGQKGASGLDRIAQGVLLLHLDEPKLAIQYLRSGLETHTTEVDGWQWLGLAYNRIGEFQKAMRAFERLTRLDGSAVSAWCDYAEAALRAGYYEAALGAAQHAQEIEENGMTLFLHATALFGLERFNPALKLFDQALEDDDSIAAIWWNKSLCARRLGRDAVANRCLHRARALDIRFWRLPSETDKPVLPYPLILNAYTLAAG